MPFVKGYKMTEETKRKIGLANKGKKSWNKGNRSPEGFMCCHICFVEFYVKPSHKKNTKCCSRLCANKLKSQYIGRKQTQETKDKLSKINKGRKLSEEAKKKMSVIAILTKRIPPPRNGILHTEATRLKFSKRRGIQTGNWKGGRTKLAQLIRSCMKYSEWRTSIFIRDEHTCQLCGARNGNGKTVYLNVDHYPKSLAEILETWKVTSYNDSLLCNDLWDTNNGRTLCVPCHKETDTYGYRNNKKILCLKDTLVLMNKV